MILMMMCEVAASFSPCHFRASYRSIAAQTDRSGGKVVLQCRPVDDQFIFLHGAFKLTEVPRLQLVIDIIPALRKFY